MQSSFRVGSYGFAFLMLLGGALTTPCLAGSMAGSQDVTAKINEMTKREKVKPVSAVKVHLLDLKPLPSVQLVKLNKDARTKYDQALAALDKINYERAVEYMQQSVQAQPEDVYLRFQLVQLAQYMGDTRPVPDDKMAGKQPSAQDYYDIAIESLQAMSTSSMLNVREKQRAMDALETVTALRQSVGERETKRHLAGEEIAKSYAKETYAATDKRERERQQKKDAVEEYVKNVNNPNPSSSANSLSAKGNFSARNNTGATSQRSSSGGSRSSRGGGGY